MIKVGFTAALLAVAVLRSQAQMSVEVTLDQEQFLPGETLEAAVRITNRSGQTLHLGEGDEWLSFSLESNDGFLVAKTADPEVAGEFDLPTFKVATKRVDLAPCFRLTKPGRYSVTATVKVKEWDQQVSSRPKSFDIIQGTKLWEQEFGMPQSPGETNAIPEVRKYVLQQANYLKAQIRLYYRMTDITGTRVYRVLPIGTMISFSRPEAQVDQYSNLHVLYQNGPRLFSYTVIDSQGEIIGRQTYEYVNARPRLKMTSEGKIGVHGGIRRTKSNDIPEEKPAISPPLESTGTNTPPPDLTAPEK